MLPSFQFCAVRTVNFLRNCASNLNFAASSFLLPLPVQYQQTETYKKANFLKLHCKGCRFQRVSGRLHVECQLKPAHKQMENMDTRLLWDDWREAILKKGRHRFVQRTPEQLAARKHPADKKAIVQIERQKRSLKLEKRQKAKAELEKTEKGKLQQAKPVEVVVPKKVQKGKKARA